MQISVHNVLTTESTRYCRGQLTEDKRGSANFNNKPFKLYETFI